MNKKIIVGGFLVILLVLAVFLGHKKFSSSQLPINQQSLENQIYHSQEYGFSVDIPSGWTYKTPSEKVGSTILVVELKSVDGKMSVPIFIDEKSWDLVKTEVQKNFLPETIQEITLAGQQAIKIVSQKEEINPGYNFRIKHPNKQNLVLLGTAGYIDGQDLDLFHNSVESVLNSIKFE
jgi:hypothetical protein